MRKGWGRGGEREWSEENKRPLGKIGDYLVWGGVQYTILHPLPTCEMVGASTSHLVHDLYNMYGRICLIKAWVL